VGEGGEKNEQERTPEVLNTETAEEHIGKYNAEERRGNKFSLGFLCVFLSAF